VTSPATQVQCRARRTPPVCSPYDVVHVRAHLIRLDVSFVLDSCRPSATLPPVTRTTTQIIETESIMDFRRNPESVKRYAACSGSAPASAFETSRAIRRISRDRGRGRRSHHRGSLVLVVISKRRKGTAVHDVDVKSQVCVRRHVV